NTILVLMSVELMLNAVNLNLIAFDMWLGDRLHSGQVLTLLIIVIAAAELGVGLAIVLAVFRNRRTVDIDRLRDLAEPTDDAPAALPPDASPSPPALPDRVPAHATAPAAGPRRGVSPGPGSPTAAGPGQGVSPNPGPATTARSAAPAHPTA